MIVKKRKCFQDIIVEIYWNARFTCNFLQIKYNFNFKKFVDFEKPFRMKFKQYEKDIKFGF
jgi:hypothetical protein